MTKMLSILFLLALCFQAQAASEVEICREASKISQFTLTTGKLYRLNPPQPMCLGDERQWRDTTPGGWDERPFTREELGLWLPSMTTFDADKEPLEWLFYLFTAWLLYPLVTFLLLMNGKKGLQMLGVLMLLLWLPFSWNRKYEMYCLFCIVPVGILRAFIGNIKRSVLG